MHGLDDYLLYDLIIRNYNFIQMIYEEIDRENNVE